MNTEFVSHLRCPQTRSAVRLADKDFVTRANLAIGRECVRNMRGDVVRRPITAALVRDQGDLFYPVVDDIPRMLVEEAIALEQLASADGLS